MPSQAHGKWIWSRCEPKILPSFLLSFSFSGPCGPRCKLLKLACLPAKACRLHTWSQTCSVYIGELLLIYGLIVLRTSSQLQSRNHNPNQRHTSLSNTTLLPRHRLRLLAPSHCLPTSQSSVGHLQQSVKPFDLQTIISNHTSCLSQSQKPQILPTAPPQPPPSAVQTSVKSQETTGTVSTGLHEHQHPKGHILPVPVLETDQHTSTGYPANSMPWTQSCIPDDDK